MGCGGKVKLSSAYFEAQLLSKWLLLIKCDIETVVDIDQLLFFYCLVEKLLEAYLFFSFVFILHMGGHVSLPLNLA